MAILDEMIANMPEQFHNKPRIHALEEAFAKQMEELKEAYSQLLTQRSIDDATGRQLDLCGDIVGITRAQSALYCKDADFDIIDDDRYRMFIKYKALRNSTHCTYEELLQGCELLFGAQTIIYNEREDRPASFSLMFNSEMDEDLLKLVTSTDLSIRSSGVKAHLSYFATDFFGFADTNRFASGFGVGKFSTGV